MSTDDVFFRCINRLPGHGPRRSMKETFQALAESLEGSEFPDRYGSGEYLNQFESEMAELFGKEAAVFMPSGTMAQQIALRIWCEKRSNFTVAMHPTAHLEIAEHLGYQYLHGIKRIQFAAPEFVSSRILSVKDLQGLGQEPGVILLELPYRPLGGELPEWEDLLAMAEWAKERKIPIHLDGARVWSSRSFYQKEYRDIASLFDSLYVSFYKDLGGLAGSMLMGSANFINEARLWQIRHGGDLPTMAPLYVSARLGYQQTLPQIDRWVERAKEVAAILSSFDRISVRPNPPLVNFFQLYIQGVPEELNQKHLELAQETGTFLFYNLGPTMVPAVAMTEIHCWENAMQFDLDRLPAFLERLLD
jgi:threonine aldolase